MPARDVRAHSKGQKTAYNRYQLCKRGTVLGTVKVTHCAAIEDLAGKITGGS
jgi:hypothetical protein